MARKVATAGSAGAGAEATAAGAGVVEAVLWRELLRLETGAQVAGWEGQVGSTWPRSLATYRHC